MYETRLHFSKHSNMLLYSRLGVSLSLFFTVGSYFALQWLANLIVAATGLATNCVQSETAATVLNAAAMFAMFGLSMIGTNLLCHRYLVEKARVMIKLYGAHGLFTHSSSPPPCQP
jgi:hypothetical protein